MIYYFYSESDDIKPPDDWHAFTYFIGNPHKEGIRVSLRYGESAWSSISHEGAVKRVVWPIPSEVKQDLVKAVFSFK